MRRIFRSIFSSAGIMMAVSFNVNAWATEPPNSTRPLNKTPLDGTGRAPADEMAKLVDLLFKRGSDFRFKEHIAPVIGLPGPTSSKVVRIAAQENGNDYFARLCYLAYVNVAHASKRPLCIYLRRHTISGHDDYDLYFRINLNGKLEKIIISQSKRDDNGKAVIGSGVATYPDVESSASKKDFDTEMAQLRTWLEAQTKSINKTAALGAKASGSTTH